MPSGGFRANAGRPKKPASEKKLEGNPGNRTVTMVEYGGNKLPKKPPDKLTERAKDIYRRTWEWLEALGCLTGIGPDDLENYAEVKDHWHDCMDNIRNHGKIIKNPDGKIVPNPYVSQSFQYMRQADAIWEKIARVVRDTNSVDASGLSPHDDMMLQLLRSRP